jgi:ParB-like chromosome segregation protein Spo0J
MCAMTTYEFHPLSEMFPLMEGKEFDDLVADIGAHGLSEPITLFEGKILDGRNRYRALRTLERGLEESQSVNFTEAWPNAARAYVISQNLHRRHLSIKQRKAIAAASR